VIANLESINSEMIKMNTAKEQRLTIMKRMAVDQLEQLSKMDIIKSVRKLNDQTYIEAQYKTGEELEFENNNSILDKSRENLLQFKNQKNL
jgi:hypothetical protein